MVVERFGDTTRRVRPCQRFGGGAERPAGRGRERDEQALGHGKHDPSSILRLEGDGLFIAPSSRDTTKRPTTVVSLARSWRESLGAVSHRQGGLLARYIDKVNEQP
jgi:hypothetical protein